MELVKLSLSISLAILPSCPLTHSPVESLMDAHHWLLSVLYGIQYHNQCYYYYKGIIILNEMYRITSTVGIDGYYGGAWP